MFALETLSLSRMHVSDISYALDSRLISSDITHRVYEKDVGQSRVDGRRDEENALMNSDNAT